MRSQTNVSIVINRPPADVFASLIDFGKWPNWGGGNLVGMEQVSEGPLRVGSQMRQVFRRGRKEGTALVRITDLVPDRTLAIERPNLRGTFDLEPAGSGTRLTARFEVEAGVMSALLYRLFLGQFVRSDLRRFKAMVEGT